MRPSLCVASVRLPFRPRSEVWSLVTLAAPDTTTPERRPLDFLLLIDRSSSMAGPRLLSAIDAASAVLDRLQPGDRFSVITFDADAEVVLPPTPFDPGLRRFLQHRLERLTPGYGTNLEAALETAARLSLEAGPGGAVRRVLLLTDGHPSLGECEPARLEALGRRLQMQGITLCCVAIGSGCDVDLLASLSQQGGALHSVSSAENIPALVRREVDGLERAAYSDVTIRLAPGPGVERVSLVHRLPVQVDGRALQVSLGELGHGDRRSMLFVSDGHGRTAELEVRLTDAFGEAAFVERATWVLGAAAPDKMSEVGDAFLALHLADALVEGWAALRHGPGAMRAHLRAAFALAHAVGGGDDKDASSRPASGRLFDRLRRTWELLERARSAEALRLRQADDVSAVTRIRASRGAA